MKNYSYIGISLVILIFGIIFIPRIVDRISDGEVILSDRLNTNNAKKDDNSSSSARTKELSYIEVNGERKKAPDFELINQEGNVITNKDFLGKVYVAEFFFTTCPTICPIMNKNLVEVQDELKGEANFAVASFSIDPVHDTPEVLKEYARNYNITNPHWHLLTGNKDEIYNLANVGFLIYAGEDEQVEGGFAHSGLFSLVDKEGYIRSRLDRFGNPIIYYRGSVERNKSVTEGEEEPQIDILIEDIKQLL